MPKRGSVYTRKKGYTFNLLGILSFRLELRRPCDVIREDAIFMSKNWAF